MYQRRQQVAKRLRFDSAVAGAGFLAYLGCACEPLKKLQESQNVSQQLVTTQASASADII